jgi:hypothetical protein
LEGFSVAVADETFRSGFAEDGGLEDPAASGWVAESFLNNRTDSEASPPESYLKEPGVGDVPFALDTLKLPL